MLNRATIRPPHLATPMQVGTQPLQLQGMHHSCNSLLPGCCSGAEDEDNSHSHSELIKWFQELLHAAQMPRWIWENPLFTIDNHIICWFNSRASSRPRSVARYPADHRLQGNLQVLLCRAQTFALKEGLIREKREYHVRRKKGEKRSFPPMPEVTEVPFWHFEKKFWLCCESLLALRLFLWLKKHL